MDEEKFTKARSRAEEVFFTSVGQSISMWSNMEGFLVAVAGMLLDTRFAKAGLILYSIPNFYSWLSIIDELFSMEQKFSAQKPEWGTIADRLKKLNDTRVRLAHHSFRRGQEIDHFPVLRPNRYDTRAKSKKYAPLEIDEIIAFMEDLTPVMERVQKLLNDMGTIYKASKLASRKTPVALVSDQHHPKGAR
jgi:hypothetical protein